jgi:hypothetical protein
MSMGLAWENRSGHAKILVGFSSKDTEMKIGM